MLFWITVLLVVGLVSEYAIFKTKARHLQEQRDRAEARNVELTQDLQRELQAGLDLYRLLDEAELRNADQQQTIVNLEATVRRHIEDEIRTSTAVALRISDLLAQIDAANVAYAKRVLEGDTVSDFN